MKKITKNIISFVLSATLLLSCLPITVSASNDLKEAVTSSTDNKKENPTIIAELTEKTRSQQKGFSFERRYLYVCGISPTNTF